MELYSDTLYSSKENPEFEIWDQISLFLSKDAMGTQYHIKPRVVKLLKYYFDQSNELFKVSQQISVNSKPLLQFYAFLNLSKLLIVIRKTKNTESLNQSHGAKVNIEKSCSLSLSNVNVKIENNGTFTELLSSLNRKTPFTNYIGKSINLYELIEHTIDLYDFMDNKNNVFPIQSCKISKNNLNEIGSEKEHSHYLEIGFINKDSFGLFSNMFDYCDLTRLKQKSYFTSIDPEGVPYRQYYSDEKDLPNLVLERNYANEYFAVKGIKIKNEYFCLYQLEIQYLLSFILSNLVRYYPNEWNCFLSNPKESWLINKVVNYLDRSFPNNLLNSLTEKSNIVFPPGILHRK